MFSIRQIINDMKIRSKILLSFLVFCFVLTLSSMFISYSIYTDAISDKIETYAGYLTNQLCDNIDRELNSNIDKLTIILSDDAMGRQFPNYLKLDSKSQFELIQKLNRNISKNLSGSRYVKMAGYMPFWDDFYIPLWNYSTEELSIENVPTINPIVCRVNNNPSIRQIIDNLKQENVQMKAEYVALEENSIGGILIAKNFKYPLSSKGSIFFTVLDVQAFVSIFENIELGGDQLGSRSEIFIANKKGIIQASNSERLCVGDAIPDAEVRKILLGGVQNDRFVARSVKTAMGEFLISAAKVGNGKAYDWFVVVMIPLAYIRGETKTILISLAFALLFFVGLSVLISFLISRNIAIPIISLNQKMREVQKGNLDVISESYSNDEIGELHRRFSKMTAEIKQLLLEKDYANEKSRELELEMLEYQINPHFLYNTLDSINWIARMNEQNEISKLVSALAKFFRIGLSKGSKFISVQDELEHARNYLYINKTRFKDAFDYSIYSDENVLTRQTLKAVLQPVVENSIKYGIDKATNSGFISIRCTEENNTICFEVTDNGIGIEEQALNDIQESLKSGIQNKKSEDGFGLMNIDQRIKLRFGNKYGVMIASEGLNRGTTVRITIPVQNF